MASLFTKMSWSTRFHWINASTEDRFRRKWPPFLEPSAIVLRQKPIKGLELDTTKRRFGDQEWKVTCGKSLLGLLMPRLRSPFCLVWQLCEMCVLEWFSFHYFKFVPKTFSRERPWEWWLLSGNEEGHPFSQSSRKESDQTSPSLVGREGWEDLFLCAHSMA